MVTSKPPLGLARKLRDDVYAVTVGRPMKWITVGELCLRHPHKSLPALEAALALAIARGWMEGAGDPPESVRLTEDGRRLGAGGRAP